MGHFCQRIFELHVYQTVDFQRGSPQCARLKKLLRTKYSNSKSKLDSKNYFPIIFLVFQYLEMFEETFIWASILVWLWVFQFPKAQNPLEEMPLWTKALWMKQENRRKANQYSSIIHVTWSPPSFDILFLQFTKCQRVKSCPLHIRPKKMRNTSPMGKSSASPIKSPGWYS